MSFCITGKKVLISVFLIFMFFAPSLVFAHKVMVFGYVEDGKVRTISKFSGGKKVQGGKIRVFDEDGVLLLEGETDKEGEFSFDIPTSKGIKIDLDAAMGHRSESFISADQLVENKTADSLKKTTDHGTESTESVTEDNLPVSDHGSNVDIETVVEAVLDRKVMPVLHMMAEREDKPRFADILGGAGYIIGIVGVVLYMKSRKKDSSC